MSVFDGHANAQMAEKQVHAVQIVGLRNIGKGSKLPKSRGHRERQDYIPPPSFCHVRITRNQDRQWHQNPQGISKLSFPERFVIFAERFFGASPHKTILELTSCLEMHRDSAYSRPCVSFETFVLRGLENFSLLIHLAHLFPSLMTDLSYSTSTFYCESRHFPHAYESRIRLDLLFNAVVCLMSLDIPSSNWNLRKRFQGPHSPNWTSPMNIYLVQKSVEFLGNTTIFPARVQTHIQTASHARAGASRF
ncbi:uncharacterized protein BDR25DRAFT_356029 [Lindgomyces ingoldianus]|uniref:Uncharacterized protein n=1 Tax=Lindgomyces ingoldianus TaxID=673940 RepID=A0ACB6QT87_9PLEO|nr:uncharacterized protein BDR25DRAFT_356029 [Lindgomyces ingoldianus]KAF2469778.1 hypothetical protein BDR25DRAFT_356029 [Lindgomyces ingoldianus]